MKLDILKDKRIIGILIAVILIIIVIVFINVNRGNSLNDKVSDTFSSKGSLLLFVYDSSDSESMYKEISKELKNRKIEYLKYDKNKVSEKTFNKLLDITGINNDDFGTPSLIYIKDGVLFANIFNINSKDDVNMFLDDYNFENMFTKLE